MLTNHGLIEISTINIDAPEERLREFIAVYKWILVDPLNIYNYISDNEEKIKKKQTFNNVVIFEELTKYGEWKIIPSSLEDLKKYHVNKSSAEKRKMYYKIVNDLFPLKPKNELESIAYNAISNVFHTRNGSCMMACELITKAFLNNKIHNFKVVEGWVEYQGQKHQHTWIETDEGRIDPTFIQFYVMGFENEKTQYASRVKRRYTPEQYLEMVKKFPESKAYLPSMLIEP